MGVFGQFARLFNACAGIGVVAIHVGHGKGRSLAVQRYRDSCAEQLDIVVARGVLHHAELISAVAKREGANDGRAVLRQVVAVSCLSAGNEKLKPLLVGGRRSNVAVVYA